VSKRTPCPSAPTKDVLGRGAHGVRVRRDRPWHAVYAHGPVTRRPWPRYHSDRPWGRHSSRAARRAWNVCSKACCTLAECCWKVVFQRLGRGAARRARTRDQGRRPARVLLTARARRAHAQGPGTAGRERRFVCTTLRCVALHYTTHTHTHAHTHAHTRGPRRGRARHGVTRALTTPCHRAGRRDVVSSCMGTSCPTNDGMTRAGRGRARPRVCTARTPRGSCATRHACASRRTRGRRRSQPEGT
jgi:hypothetical protein